MLPNAHDACGNPTRAVVHQQSGTVLDRLELLQRHVEPVRPGKGAGGDQRVAATHAAALDAREREGDPLTCLTAHDRLVVHLHATDAHPLAGRRVKQLIVLRDRPDQSVPVTTVPIPRRVKTRSTNRRDGRSTARACTCADARASAARSSASPSPVTALTATASADGTSSDASATASSSVLGVDRVCLRDRDDPLRDPEQMEHGEVLMGLRASSLSRVDHEEEEIDSGRPGNHRAHEPLVAGNIDQRQSRAVVEQERRVPEIDRDPAPPLLGQPIRVLPRERLDQLRLAVVDVPGGSDRQRHGSLHALGCRLVTIGHERVAARAAVTAEATSSTSSSAIVRASRSSRPSRITPTTDGSPTRRGRLSDSSTAHANEGSSVSGSAPPPTRATVSSISPPTSPTSRSARARIVATGSSSMRNTGISARAVPGRDRQRACLRARRG